MFKTYSLRKPKLLNTGTLDEWHNKIGHLYKEALSHMPGVTTGVKLTTLSLLVYKYKQCYLTNSKQILSRRPSPIPPTEPYIRVDFDLIYIKINELTK